MPRRIDRPPAPIVPNTPSTPVTTNTTPSQPANVVRPDGFDPAARSTSNTRGIETVFTPGDAARQMELAALDEIIAARKADPRTFTAAENPYQIDYAIYNMTDPEVIRRLAEASRAGIAVQVLIDAGQITPKKPWNTVVDELKAEGFSHAETQKGLTAEELRDTQIIEIDLPGSGLFHFKSRYFAYPDPATGKIKETLLSGSANPQEAAHKNDESLHRITDPALIGKYVDAITAIRDGRPVQNVWSDEAASNVLFTAPGAQGPKAVDKIFELVDKEQELIALPMFTLRNLVGPDQARLVDRLAAARERGAKVIVITDHKQADGVDINGNRRSDSHDDNTDDLLQAAGIPTYEVLNKAGPFNAMHLKSAVFGVTNPKIVTDTGNWTFATFGNGRTYGSKNAESLLFIDSQRYDDGHTGRKYLGEFLRLLRKYQPVNAGQPPAETLIRELQSMPGWPKVKVSFDVLARTHWGQEVYITGNIPELGGWGATGPGIKLDTNPDTYPYWQNAEVELPLGMQFEYKVIKRSPDGRIDWEPGQNAMLLVDPTDAHDTARISVKEDFNGDR